ncbi:hypothetical protein LJR130_001805 [Variovorax sp. LjRoot130]|jgi:hypothetical protein|uniref:hypothetical protein n=1 Tax=Variovorax sp. LjRoot130 TaxID=3342261 RepID=UPI003ECDE9DA
MFTFLPARWLAALPALAALAAGAQTSPAPNTAAATEAAAPLSFRSAMEGYKPFAEEKPIPWKEANETVYQRGGWRAYAKEGAGETDDPHAGHSMSTPMAAPPKEKP